MSTSEQLASWFFRLNGCAIIQNFIVHPDSPRGSQRTDLDVLGVRFPHRAERLESGTPFEDHPALCEPRDGRTLIILVEVKTSQCAVNGPWTERSKGNMQRVLRAVGAFPEHEIESIAGGLYETGKASSDRTVVKMFAVGSEIPPSGSLTSECVPLTWREILAFIHGRMRKYWQVKAQHDQWDAVGNDLYKSAVENYFDDQKGFIDHWVAKLS